MPALRQSSDDVNPELVGHESMGEVRRGVAAVQAVPRGARTARRAGRTDRCRGARRTGETGVSAVWR